MSVYVASAYVSSLSFTTVAVDGSFISMAELLLPRAALPSAPLLPLFSTGVARARDRAAFATAAIERAVVAAAPSLALSLAPSLAPSYLLLSQHSLPRLLQYQ